MILKQLKFLLFLYSPVQELTHTVKEHCHLFYIRCYCKNYDNDGNAAPRQADTPTVALTSIIGTLIARLRSAIIDFSNILKF